MEQSERVFIGLGANVGAALTAITGAVAVLEALPGADVVAVSRLYRTRPVGPVAQDDFLNAVVELRVAGASESEAAAMALLHSMKALERDAGRQQRQRWGPREIDLDLLLFGSHQLRVKRPAAARSDDPARGGVQWLEVPHPAAVERLFVLAPLADLAPGLEPPGWGQTVAEARDRALAREGPAAVRAIATWDVRTARWLDVSDGSGDAP